MSNIFLDRKDAEAIAREREYDVPDKTRGQRWAEQITFTGWLLFGAVGVILTFLDKSLAVTKMWSGGWGICLLIAIAFGVTYLGIRYKNEEPLRKARRDFLTKWEKTGEIPPRWPGRLKKNQQDNGRPYQNT